MTTRYRTAFMASSGFSAATQTASKSDKHAISAGERKAARAARTHIKIAEDAALERPGKSEAA